ncbi:PLP-dependent aminotransferase family protein [Aliivibrio kagoshimensis]|uniref:aminotransferase-like domain-containing protein n=1 Tax=Aliivibrio kagoshimensis TaxID=2910230 RepID=UPI003D10A7DC
MKRYEQLAHDLKLQIKNKVWNSGDKLPSIRASCTTSGFSLATVLQGYQLLESQGLIISKPQSGYYVAPQTDRVQEPSAPSQQLMQSDTVDINNVLFDLLQKTKNPDIVPFSSAFPDPKLFPQQALARALASSMRRMPASGAVSNLPPGSEALRRCIAQRYALDGINVSPDDIVITSGALESLNLSLQAVTQPGDLVAIESPTFYGALQAIERLKLKAIEIPTHPKKGVDLEVLKTACEQQPIKACWLMTNFQNPLGFVMGDEKKKALADLLEKHHIPLIEDDVYAELYFTKSKPLPAKYHDKSGNILHCSSFSKCLSPGYRVGWVVAGPYAEKIQRLQLMSTLSASVPTQLGLATYLQQGGYDSHLRKLRRTLEQRKSQMLQAVIQYFPTNTRISQPDGGYFLWIELPEQVNSEQLYQQALTQNIGIAPGMLFTTQDHCNHHIRLNFSPPWTESTELAIKTLGKLIKSTT